MTEQPTREEVEQYLSEQAAAFEQARAERMAVAEKTRQRRARRINAQIWFLFVVLFASFALLAYRTEVNSAQLEKYIYEACTGRVERAIKYNEGREVLIDLILHNPRNAVPADQQAQLQQQLEQGLLLPIEDCQEDLTP